MGRQVPFFAVGEDYQALLSAAEEAGLSALPAEIAAGTKPPRVAPTSFTLPPGSRLFYLVPNEVDDDDLVFAPLANQPSRAALRLYASAAIELCPSPVNGTVVHDGRIYLSGESSQPKPELLTRCYERVARVTKRWPKADQFNFRIGPATAEAVKRGSLSLKHLRYDLKVAE